MDSDEDDSDDIPVSKLFRAYGLYNGKAGDQNAREVATFQSSFELTGYITNGYGSTAA